MKPEMALARGTAHPVNYGVFVPGGGMVTFTTAELGFALGAADPERRLSPGVANLLLLKYGQGDYHDAAALFRALSAEYRRRSQGWEYAVANGRLCWTAIQEAVDGRQCRLCLGTRAVKVQDRYETCGTCQGSGRRRWSTHELAARLGIDQATVVRQVGKPYAARLARLIAMEDEGLTHVWNKTRGL
ncbi:MAG: hypothetical protein AB7Q97_01970 [Gammaproteobacteria bacterium]